MNGEETFEIRNPSDSNSLNDGDIFHSDSFIFDLPLTARKHFGVTIKRLKKEIPELYSSSEIYFPAYPLPISVIEIKGKHFLEFIVEKYYPSKKEYDKFMNFLACFLTSHPNRPKVLPDEVFRMIKSFLSPKIFKFVAKIRLEAGYPFLRPKVQILYHTKRTKPLILDENNWHNQIEWCPPCKISHALLIVEAEMFDENTEEFDYFILNNETIISQSAISVNKRHTTIKTVMKTIEDRVRRDPTLARQIKQLLPPDNITNTNLTLLDAGYGEKCQSIIFSVVF
mmetsp:Transcript_29716/g.32345  ORF Transcript_29716/g.32345 Transcript_29716/m.32345 type:complete len:283 (-) Transcript_29716:148-996(-)|eukprot:gene4596-4927_t